MASKLEHIEFGVVRPRSGTFAPCVDIPRVIFRQLSSANNFANLFQDQSLKVAPIKNFQRVYSNSTGSSVSGVHIKGTNAFNQRERQLRNFIDMLRQIDQQTITQQRDPNLRVFPGLRKRAVDGSLPLRVTLTLPETVGVAEFTAAATECRQSMASCLNYMSAGGPKIPAVNFQAGTDRRWTLLADNGQSPRGIIAFSQTRSTGGAIVTEFSGYNLGSHAEQIICIAALAGAVVATRQPD